MPNSKFQIPNSFLSVSFSLFLTLIGGLFSGLTVNAAELYLQIPNSKFQIHSIDVGQQFQVDFMIDTEGEAINAVAGKIIFPDSILELKEIRDGNSIINFWIERPSLNSKSYILYSGIIPGGFKGENGLIFSAIFEAKEEGVASSKIENARVLRNDGKGTEAKTRILNLEFRISKSESQIPDSIFQIPDSIFQIPDHYPPELFVPEIAKDEELFDGKLFLVFATQDKGTGIAKYEVRELRHKILTPFSKWLEAESPYLLKDQELKSYIFVKAVDKAGNERIVVIESRYPLKWYEVYWIWGIIILIIAVIIFMIIRSRKIKCLKI